MLTQFLALFKDNPRWPLSKDEESLQRISCFKACLFTPPSHDEIYWANKKWVKTNERSFKLKEFKFYKGVTNWPRMQKHCTGSARGVLQLYFTVPLMIFKCKQCVSLSDLLLFVPRFGKTKFSFKLLLFLTTTNKNLKGTVLETRKGMGNWWASRWSCWLRLMGPWVQPHLEEHKVPITGLKDSCAENWIHLKIGGAHLHYTGSHPTKCNSCYCCV